MITDVYSHILDEDRKINAQKFEAANIVRALEKRVSTGTVDERSPCEQAPLARHRKAERTFFKVTHYIPIPTCGMYGLRRRVTQGSIFKHF